MNTIKVYLKPSGAIASLDKDFPLFQYQYQNKLLNVYVPTSITEPNFVGVENNQIVVDGVSGTALKARLSYVTQNGRTYESKSYYLRYIKTLTKVDSLTGVSTEYALFERKLPKEFTYYAGVGSQAPQMTFNVVVVNTKTVDGNQAKTILSITSTQTCELEVMPSTSQDIDEVVDATEMEDVQARLNAIDGEDGYLSRKQDKVDGNIIDTINENNKEVVKSLNSANATAKNNQDRLNGVDTQIGDIYGRIERLELNISTGETYLGQVESSYAPNTEEAYNLVNQYAINVTGGNIKINSVIIYIQKLENDTDKIFKYTYGMNLESGLKEWSYYEIQYLETASNTTKGIVKGSYDSNNYVNGEVYVNIIDGNIQNIYFISNGRPTDIKEICKYMEDIASGERHVEKALKDANGNEIATTYMPKSIGATKQLVKDYALPRIFNDTLYLDSTTHNVVKSKDLLPDDAPSDYIVFNSIGEHKFPDYIYIIPQVEGESVNFNISSKNSIRNKLTLRFTPTQTEALDFICRVYYAKLVDSVYEPNQLLGVNSIKIIPNEAIVNNEVIEVIFDELASVENNTIELQSGDKFIFEYAINSVNSTSTTAFILTAKTASSCVNLNVDSVVKTILKGDVEEIDLSIGNPQSLTYDNVDGINLVETSKIIYTNGEENEIVSKREIPIVADKNIIMDVNENATKVLLKVDSTNTLDNSTKPVESNAVLNALNNVVDTLDASLDTKANKVTINTTSASPITLTDNTSFRLGTISTLTINNATSYPLDFMCEIVFTSGSGFSMDYSALAITFSGDDCDSGVFTPTDAKTYNILFFNNSNNETTSLQAIVRGV